MALLSIFRTSKSTVAGGGGGGGGFVVETAFGLLAILSVWLIQCITSYVHFRNTLDVFNWAEVVFKMMTDISYLSI